MANFAVTLLLRPTHLVSMLIALAELCTQSPDQEDAILRNIIICGEKVNFIALRSGFWTIGVKLIN